MERNIFIKRAAHEVQMDMGISFSDARMAIRRALKLVGADNAEDIEEDMLEAVSDGAREIVRSTSIPSPFAMTLILIDIQERLKKLEEES